MPLHRRALIAGLAATAAAGRAAAQEEPIPDRIELWPGPPPGGGALDHEIRAYAETREGAITAVAHPALLTLRPGRPNGTAVIVAAGGGYRRIEAAREGFGVGRWLAGLGVTVFVLVYRLPGEGWTAGPDAPLADAQRAVRMVRGNARAWGLDPARIGALGFSAGGHLMGMLSVAAERELYAPCDSRDGLSARPNFSGLVYPVITLRAPFDVTSSRRMLVGETPTSAASEAYSVERAVSSATPPTFLTASADDPVVPVDNTLLMFAALRAKGVPAEMHLFEKGGHGYNLGVPGSPPAAWPGLFAAWAGRNGFLKA